MKCKSCDKLLNDYELKRKLPEQPETFADLCGQCYSASNENSYLYEVDQVEYKADD